MTPQLPRLAVLGSLAALACAGRDTDFRVAGWVIDGQSRHFLPGAAVQVTGLSARTTTDSTGHFALEGKAPVGCYQLRLSAPGRRTVVVRFSISPNGHVLGGGFPLMPADATQPDSLLTGECGGS